jgi:hypothetical protein
MPSPINKIIFFAVDAGELSSLIDDFESEPIATNSISFPGPQAKSIRVLKVSKDFFILFSAGFQ